MADLQHCSRVPIYVPAFLTSNLSLYFMQANKNNNVPVIVRERACRNACLIWSVVQLLACLDIIVPRP